ncbi:hypothetical protein ACN267_26835 [Micromonospora sp. WMMD734]|uniref:hypothetical protein n=1 Tax=Micromonospora TaxID=1873 RepID=UPI001EF4D4EE|nr:hypothetical protein [Micromonospora humidisoli]
MRRALSFLVTRALRSRIGIALMLAVSVLAVIGAARLVAGPGEFNTGLNRPREPITTVEPDEGDDGVVGAPSPEAPVVAPGQLPPAQTAIRFTTAWLDHTISEADQWRSKLHPFSTPELMEKLAGAGPDGAPRARVTGEPEVRPRNATFAEVVIPLDAGILRLELVAPDGRWLVDAVDWERK